MIVAPVVAVDVLIVLIGTSVPSLRLNATVAEDSQHPMAIDVSKSHSTTGILSTAHKTSRLMESQLFTMYSCA